MARKKKSELNTEIEVQDLEVAESAAEQEAEEAQALAADDSEAEAATAAKEEVSEEPKEAIVDTAAADEEVAEEVTKSKRRASRSRKKNEPAPSVDLREEAAIASVTMQRSMESMVKQWAAVKDITGTLATNLERIQKQMTDLQANYDDALDRLTKQVPVKPAPITKVAMGVASLSIVVSVLSFSFAQSARSRAILPGTPGTAAAARAANQQSPNWAESAAPQIAASSEGFDSAKLMRSGTRKNSVKTKK